MRVFCILIVALFLFSTPIWGQETPNKDSVRAEATLSVIGVVEQNFFREYRQYAKLETLISMGWLKPEEATNCEMVLNWEGKRFVAVIRTTEKTYYVDKRQIVTWTPGDITAQELLKAYCDLEPYDEVLFFNRKAEELCKIPALIQQHIKDVQIDIERWAVDHGGTYPATIDDIVIGGYAIKGFYANPCTATKIGEKDAYEVTTWSAGNFKYIPAEVGGEIVGYELIGYGPDPTTDGDGDGVSDGIIITISSGRNAVVR